MRVLKLLETVELHPAAAAGWTTLVNNTSAYTAAGTVRVAIVERLDRAVQSAALRQVGELAKNFDNVQEALVDDNTLFEIFRNAKLYLGALLRLDDGPLLPQV